MVQEAYKYVDNVHRYQDSSAEAQKIIDGCKKAKEAREEPRWYLDTSDGILWVYPKAMKYTRTAPSAHPETNTEQQVQSSHKEVTSEQATRIIAAWTLQGFSRWYTGNGALWTYPSKICHTKGTPAGLYAASTEEGLITLNYESISEKEALEKIEGWWASQPERWLLDTSEWSGKLSLRSFPEQKTYDAATPEGYSNSSDERSLITTWKNQRVSPAKAREMIAGWARAQAEKVKKAEPTERWYKSCGCLRVYPAGIFYSCCIPKGEPVYAIETEDSLYPNDRISVDEAHKLLESWQPKKAEPEERWYLCSTDNCLWLFPSKKFYSKNCTGGFDAFAEEKAVTALTCCKRVTAEEARRLIESWKKPEERWYYHGSTELRKYPGNMFYAKWCLSGTSNAVEESYLTRNCQRCCKLISAEDAHKLLDLWKLEASLKK